MAVQAHFYSENSGLPICLQDWSVSQVFGIDNGLLFTSLPYPPQPQFQQNHNCQNLDFNCNQGSSSSFSCNTAFPSIPLSQALNTQLEIQRHEIDRVLLSQVMAQDEASYFLSLYMMMAKFPFFLFFFFLGLYNIVVYRSY